MVVSLLEVVKELPSPKSHLYVTAPDDVFVNCKGVLGLVGLGEYVYAAVGLFTTTRFLVMVSRLLQVLASLAIKRTL